MSPLNLPESMRRVGRFCAAPLTWIILLFAAGGFIMAVQSKTPLEMALGQPRMLEEMARPGEHSLMMMPPVFHYDGPVIVTLRHAALAAPAAIRLESAGAVLADARIEPGSPGIKQFHIPADTFTPRAGLTFVFATTSSAPLKEKVEKVTFTFPKAGRWLMPDLLLLAGLLVITLAFGAICALLWDSPINVLSSYIATALMLIFACHLGGLEMMWRIGNQLIAVIFLLLALILFRWLIIPSRMVTVKTRE